MLNIDNKTAWISCLVFLCLFVLMVALWFYKNSNSYASTYTLPITFSTNWTNQTQFAGMFTALEHNFYKDASLDVDVHEYKDGGSVVNDLLSGNSQFGLMSGSEFLINYSQGKPIKALAAFYQISPYVIVSLKQNNITSPLDLKGKTFGIKGKARPETETMIDLILDSKSMKKDDLNIIGIPMASSEKDDLLNKTADAIGFYRTRLYQLTKEGLQYDVIYPEQNGVLLYNDVLVTTDNFLNIHPEETRSFVKASVAGWDYAYSHKEEAISDTLKYVTDRKYLDPDYERFILSESEPLMRPTNETKIGDMDIKNWTKTYNSLLADKLLAKSFDVSQAFTTEYLP